MTSHSFTKNKTTEFIHPHDKHPNDVLMAILDLEDLDVNLFRGYSPKRSLAPRVYGGQTVAQALVAAGRTVDGNKYSLHSLHSYFLRPGSLTVPIIYRVERVRDGASFATRRVSASQYGKEIFIMDASFMVHEKGLEHQYSMPSTTVKSNSIGHHDTNMAISTGNTKQSLSDPTSFDSWEENYRRFAKEKGILNAGNAPRWSPALPFPLDVRRVVGPTAKCDHRYPRQLLWMKTVSNNTNTSVPLPLLYHHAALAYMSDFAFLETSLMAHKNAHWSENPNTRPKLQLASIDHAMWFHHPFRSDDWLLYEIDSSVSSGGRGHATGRFYTQSGLLVVSCAQEGLIRVKDWNGLSDERVSVERPSGKEIFCESINLNDSKDNSKKNDQNSNSNLVVRSKL